MKKAPVKASPRLKYAVFSPSPWKWEMCVFHGGTKDQFAASVKKHIDADIGDTISGAMGYCYVEMDKPVMVWVHDIGDIPTLVHELIHAVFGMLNGRGLTHSKDSEEAFTYSLEAVLKAIMANKKWEAA